MQFLHEMSTQKRLYKSPDNRMIEGICGGIGEYLDVDPTFVRIIWLIFTFAGGAGLIAYIIASVVVPERPIEDVYCPSCGAETEQGADYCRQCGSKLK